LIGSLIGFAAFGCLKPKWKSNDEETDPLLHQPTSTLNGSVLSATGENVQYGSISSDENSGATAAMASSDEAGKNGDKGGCGDRDSDDDDGNDDENSWWARPRKDPRKGWLAYFRAFIVSLRSLGSALVPFNPIEPGPGLDTKLGVQVFFPYIWPTERPLLQFNVAGMGICMLADRFLNALVPLQLGLVVNILSERQGVLISNIFLSSNIRR
jgi:hypothetical protein